MNMKRLRSKPLQAGDRVVMKVAVPLRDYFYCQWLDHGRYHSADILAGTIGVVIVSHTPCVTKRAGEPYFANVDVEVAPGQVVRVRPLHSQIKRVTNSAQQ